MMADKQNRAFRWATAFLRELNTCGVSHLVISPGSRSTPLTLAAAVHPGLKTHVVLDERSAGFMALGIAKQTGTPAGLICTSGTAAANYFPAVVEARHSGVPLLLLTADRPPNLRNVGASQAIDQLKLYGDYPVFFHDAGEPVLEAEDLGRLRTAASQSMRTAVKRKGPAHINFPFRKPLEPSPDCVKGVEWENQKLVTGNQIPKTTVVESTAPVPISEEIKTLLSEAERPVVIAGPHGINSKYSAAHSLANALNAPLLSEFPSSAHKNRMRGFDGYLKNEKNRTTLQPDLILRFGLQPVSKALHLYLQQHTDVPHIHFSDTEEWQDATHSVTHRVEYPGLEIDLQLDSVNTQTHWLDQWKKLDQQFIDFKVEQLEAEQRLTDGHVFHHAGLEIPAEWNIFLSNSFPVRDWMLFAGSPSHPTFVNRGASGIDGIISTAIGATIAGNRPGLLFIGDLATLHDSNALLSAKLLDQPLVVVLLNNGGGNIFRMLPIYKHKKQLYTHFFEAPQTVDFEALSDSHDLNFTSIQSIDQLGEIRWDDFTDPGIHLVECKTDSEASMKLRHELWNFSG